MILLSRPWIYGLEFAILNSSSWINDHKITIPNSWSWTYNLELTILNSWSWINGYDIFILNWRSRIYDFKFTILNLWSMKEELYDRGYKIRIVQIWIWVKEKNQMWLLDQEYGLDGLAWLFYSLVVSLLVSYSTGSRLWFNRK